MSPAPAGATTSPTLRIQPVIAFNATSCSAVRAITGDTTACAGCVMLSTIALTAPLTYDTSAGAPRRSETAVPPSASACAT